MPNLLPLAAQPNPIVLDPSLKTPLGAKLITNARKGTGRRPTVLTTRSPAESEQYELAAGPDGATVIQVARERGAPDTPVDLGSVDWT